ncbi:phage tail tape measure protein [Deinococcus multiflagellatus]|uniref:Phage tail tape measure protein n=1 Tax=Deinococcus multiflagellatus TaxID=1656887 RepID=A0ABW1ZRK1_9DEIO
MGGAINTGLFTGMGAGKPKVGRGAQDLGDEVISALKTRLQIRSPSRITQMFGLNAAEGLALGMKSGQAQVAKAAAELGNTAKANVNAALQGLAGPKLAQTIGGSAGAFNGLSRSALNGAGAISRVAISAEALAFVAGTAAAAITVLATAFTAVVNSGAAFEEQLVNIKALTQPTAEEMVKLKDAAMNLGLDLGVGPKDAALAMLELNKAGLSAQQVIGGGLTGALNLAGAAGITAGEGANMAVSAMTAFGLVADDLPRVADVFANFANKTTLTASDLSQFFASLGPAAKDAGLNIEQVAGYAATLAQAGFKQMADAGTSFKTFLTSLQAPSDTAKKSLKQLEVSFYDAAGATRPLGEVLEETRQKLAKLSDERRNGLITDIFGSDASRAARAFFGFTNEAIEENIKAMGLQGEAARVARERMESYAGQVKVLRAEWEAFTAMIGLIFLPALTSIIKGIRNVVESVRLFLNDGERLRQLMQNTAIVVTGVGLAFVYLRQEMIKTAVIGAWTALPGIFAASRLAIVGAATAIKTTFIPAIVAAAKATAAFLAANPWLLVIAGTTAAAVALNNHYSEMRRTYDEIDASNQASHESTMKRVRELNKEGGELNNVKAKYLLAVQSLADAEMGQVQATTIFDKEFWTGERKTSRDEEDIARRRKAVQDYHAELTRLNTEAARRPPVKPINIDPKEVEKQKKALKDLREELAGRQLELRVKGMTELGGQIEQLGNQFDALAIKLKTAFNFDLNNSDLQKGLAEIRAQQAREQTALVKDALDKQKEVRLGHERDVRAAEAALSDDALARRRSELNAQIEDLRTTYAPQIAELLRNAQNKNLSSGDRRQFQDEAGQLQVLQNRQILALERQRDKELEQIAQERLDKVRAAQQETLSSQVRISDAVIRVLEGQRDRELAMAGDVPQARLAIEQRYAPSSSGCASSNWPWKRRRSAAPCAPRTCNRCGTRPARATSGRPWNARPGPNSSMGCVSSNWTARPNWPMSNSSWRNACSRNAPRSTRKA